VSVLGRTSLSRAEVEEQQVSSKNGGVEQFAYIYGVTHIEKDDIVKLYRGHTMGFVFMGKKTSRYLILMKRE